MINRGLVAVAALMAHGAPAALGQAVSPDTLQGGTLGNVDVHARRQTSALRGLAGGTLTWDMEMMNSMPKILGNADPLRYSQMLPGISSNSELDAGLHIQGCDNGHNMVSLGGAPVFNASHLLGFFSVFNAGHYPTLKLTRSAQDAFFPDRLGGVLEMSPPMETTNSVGGEASAGIISSQGTLRAPAGRRSSAFISARAAYLNLLYRRWLRMGESSLGYNFGDYNATWVTRLTERDIVRIDAYAGNDDIEIDGGANRIEGSMKWGNVVASATWRHSGDGNATTTHTAYFSRHWSRTALEQNDVGFGLPADIMELGLKSHHTAGRLTAGLELAWDRVRPQSPRLTGTSNDTHARPQTQDAVRANLMGGYAVSPGDYWELKAGLRATLLLDADRHAHFMPDHNVSLALQLPHGVVRLDYATRHQYLHHTGFSSLGLPTEYWMASDRRFAPQSMRHLGLAAEHRIGQEWGLSAELYFKMLDNQLEYSGDLFDLLNEDYDVANHLVSGSGRNYGINVMIHRRTGPISGWLCYTLSRTTRHYDEGNYRGTFVANHDRTHELDAVLTYRPHWRWTFGATVVWASGTPFTAPRNFYLLNEHVVSEYGRHNANRLSAMFRLDLSANFIFGRRGGTEHGLNLSVYNATNRGNDITYSLRYARGRFSYAPLQMIFFPLPSISYYIRF